MSRTFIVGAFIGGAAFSAVCGAIVENALYHRRDAVKADIKSGYIGAVGDTPLIHLKSLSEATGCTILAKAEYLNPGASVKDRAAVRIITDGIKSGALKPGGTIVEASGGNTGISLANVARAMGYKCIIAIPEVISEEKKACIRSTGAGLLSQPIVPFSDPRHYFHTAERVAGEIPGGFFSNQFENNSNYLAHFEGTGPEILKQTNGKVDAFICACGTGGTLAGISSFLKKKLPWVQAYLIDPPGSSLFSYVTSCSLDSKGSTIMEGIGINRITQNFKQAKIDGAFQSTDREAIEMVFYLLRNEGIFIGPSSGVNCVGAVKLARKLGPGKTIVTILCDGGERYQSKLFNPKYLKDNNVDPKAQGHGLEFIE